MHILFSKATGCTVLKEKKKGKEKKQVHILGIFSGNLKCNVYNPLLNLNYCHFNSVTCDLITAIETLDMIRYGIQLFVFLRSL